MIKNQAVTGVLSAMILVAVTGCGGGGGGGGAGGGGGQNPGGGGGGSGGGGGGNDTPPTIAESLNRTINENETLVADLGASAGEGGDLSFSVSGDDAAFFEVTTDGVLRSTSGFDFENPQDAGGDNTYNVDYSVTEAGSGLSADGSLTLTIRNLTDDAVAQLVGTVGGDLWGSSLTYVPDFGTQSEDYVGIGVLKVGVSNNAQGALVRISSLLSENGVQVDLNNIDRSRGVTFFDSSQSESPATAARAFVQPSFLYLDSGTADTANDILALPYASYEAGEDASVEVAAIRSRAFNIASSNADLSQAPVADSFESTTAATNPATAPDALAGDFNGDGVDEVVVKGPGGFVFVNGSLVFQTGEESFLDRTDNDEQFRALTVGNATGLVVPDVFGDGGDDLAVFVDRQGIYLVSGQAVLEATDNTNFSLLGTDKLRFIDIEELDENTFFRVVDGGDLFAGSQPDFVFALDNTADADIRRNVYILPGSGYSSSGNSEGSLADFDTIVLTPQEGEDISSSVSVVDDVSGDGRDDIVVGTEGFAYVVASSALTSSSASGAIEDLPASSWFQLERRNTGDSEAVPFKVAENALSVPAPSGGSHLFIGSQIDSVLVDGTVTLSETVGATFFIPATLVDAAFGFDGPVSLDGSAN